MIIRSGSQRPIPYPYPIVVGQDLDSSTQASELAQLALARDGWQTSTFLEFAVTRSAFIINDHLVFSPSADLKQRGSFNSYDIDGDIVTVWGGARLSTQFPIAERIVYRGDVAVLADRETNVPATRPRTKQHRMSRGWRAREWAESHTDTMFLLDDKLVRSMADVQFFDSNDLSVEGYTVSYLNGSHGLIGLKQLIWELGPKLFHIADEVGR